MLELANQANLSEAQLTLIEDEIAAHRSLEDVLKWGLAQPAGTVLRQVIADVIAQDEYSHDVIVPWRDGLVLVYGTT